MGKKLLSLVLVLSVCLCLFAPSVLAGTPTSFVILPSSMSALNVRSGPGTNYAVAGWVVNGDEIDILKEGSTWTKIRVTRSAKVGYIKNIYIEDQNPGVPDKPDTSGSAQAGRTTSGVNLRKGPGTSFKSNGTLSSGTKLKIFDSKGNWYYVATPSGKDGWVSKSYVALGYTQVTTAKVNMREAVNGKVIKSLAKGTTVNVQLIVGSWSKVKVGSTVGYVYNQYLK